MAVLTDTDLIRMLKDGRTAIELEENTVITPSARERIHAKGIEVVFLPVGTAAAKPKAQQPWEHLVVTSSMPTTQEPRYICEQTGGFFTEKPEHMTALRGNRLVFKNHPRIVLRGAIDQMVAQLLLVMNSAYSEHKTALVEDLDSIKVFLYQLQLSEVGETPLQPLQLLGLDDAQLREHSHNPKKYYGVEHLFQADYTLDRDALKVNALRAQARELEITAFDTFFDGQTLHREEIIRALNRLSSAFYIIELKAVAGMYQNKTSERR